jgi:hypothetical protein
MHVQAGGVIEMGGKTAMVIEKQGIATSGGRVTLVAKDGRLDTVHKRSGWEDPKLRDGKSCALIFGEPGALIADDVKEHATVFSAAHVSSSPVDDLFTYDRMDNEAARDGYSSPNEPKRREQPKNSAPLIQTIKPNEGYAGDIVEIHGSGFSETTSVNFLQGAGNHPAEFRIMSDSVLRVEVPQSRNLGSVFIVVKSPGGVAATFGRGVKPITTPNTRGTGGLDVAWIGKGGSLETGGGGCVTLIDNGGILNNGGASTCTYFVKDGGIVLDGGRGAGGVFYVEPNAKLADKFRSSENCIEVPKINICPVDVYFNHTHYGSPGYREAQRRR